MINKLVTEPIVAPIANKIKGTCEGWIRWLMVAVNASHLWFLWFVFLSFEEEQRRFLTVAIGTVYPTAASIAAVSQGGGAVGKSDTTFWLTYWSSYSILFLAMDYLENFLGEIRGFYSICLVATVWLFLPMFNGAESVFREILVPLTGQYESKSVLCTFSYCSNCCLAALSNGLISNTYQFISIRYDTLRHTASQNGD